MNCSKMVSVIMCVYNTPQEYLNEAVLSILKQTYKQFELIIVDDNSSSELFNSDLFRDKRIKILKNKENRGPSYSRNRALEVANGEYIAIMDSDDISLPNRLETQVKFMEQNPSVVVAGTWFQNFGEKNNIVKREIDDNEYYRCCLLFGNVPTLLNSSAMIRRSILEKKVIRYDNSLRYGEDYKMWVELAQYGEITNIKKVLVKYRIHKKQVTYNNLAERQKLKLDSKIKLMQMELISTSFTSKEKEMFVSYFKDKKISAIKYYHLLKKICLENKKSCFLKQSSLEKRVESQWDDKLLSINNPFSLLFIQIRIPGQSFHILSLKLKQLFNKFRKSNSRSG